MESIMCKYPTSAPSCMMSICLAMAGILFTSGLAIGQNSHQPRRGVVNFAPQKTIEAAPTGFSGKTLLANADFDEDGMPDLAVVRGDGYSVAVSILSGNVRSIHPNAPIDGVNVLDIPADQPFFRREGIVETNLADVTAAFVGAGDFNADGHRDIVIADNDKLVLHFLLGDGRGAFPRSQTVEIGEFIRALKVAEVNRYDGLEDIVIRPRGHRLAPLALRLEPRLEAGVHVDLTGQGTAQIVLDLRPVRHHARRGTSDAELVHRDTLHVSVGHVGVG